MDSETNRSNDKRVSVEEVVALADKLAEGVQSLPRGAFDKIEFLDKRGRATKRWLWIIGVFSVVLLVVGGLTVYNTVKMSHALNVQRTRACAFYTIFLQADTPQAREASPDKAAYDHAYVVIRANYAALHCTPEK